MKTQIEGKIYTLCGVVNVPMLEKVYRLEDIEDNLGDYVAMLSENFPKAMTIQPYIKVGDNRSLFVFINLDIDNGGEGYQTEKVINLVKEYPWSVPYKDFKDVGEAINSYIPEGSTIH